MDTIGSISLIVGILSLGYSVHTARQLTFGMKIGVLRELRTAINRMEEDKQKCPQDSVAWMSMHHTQQQLDAVFKNVQAMFKISDKDAPVV